MRKVADGKFYDGTYAHIYTVEVRELKHIFLKVAIDIGTKEVYAKLLGEKNDLL